MSEPSPFAVIFARRAADQVTEAVAWWRGHREAAPELLARQIEEAIDLLGDVPEAGRRVISRRFRGVRRLTLSAGYLLFYQVNRESREVRVVAFRHGRQKPLP